MEEFVKQKTYVSVQGVGLQRIARHLYVIPHFHFLKEKEKSALPQIHMLVYQDGLEMNVTKLYVYKIVNMGVLVLRRIPVLVLRDGLMQIVRHRRANKLAVTAEIVLHQMYARVLPIGKDRIVARLYVRKPA